MSFGQTIIYYLGVTGSTVWETIINIRQLWTSGEYGVITVSIIMVAIFMFLAYFIFSRIENMSPVAKFFIILVMLGLFSYAGHVFTEGESLNLGNTPEINNQINQSLQILPIVDLMEEINATS